MHDNIDDRDDDDDDDVLTLRQFSESFEEFDELQLPNHERRRHDMRLLWQLAAKFGIGRCFTQHGVIIVVGADGKRVRITSAVELDKIPMPVIQSADPVKNTGASKVATRDFDEDSEVGEGKTVKRVNLTRWSAREDACKSLRDSWHEVIKALEVIRDDCTEKPASHKKRSNGNSLKVEQTGNGVNADLYESLRKFFVDQRENFKYFEEMAMELSASKQYSKDLGKRQPKRKKNADETPEEEISMTANDTFRINTFLVIIDRLASELEKRKKAYDNFNEKFSFLTKMSELSSSTLTKKARSLEEMYPNDLETELVQECIHFRSHISSQSILVEPDSPSLQSLSSFLRKQSLQNVYPNLDIALRMALCTPATNCSGERSFSCLKRVKNYLRSTLSQEKLNALALLCIESELMNKITYDDIIDDFANKKSRKKVL
ncbi:unnamed protein product [Chilo suppressalis]|uniref:HAT C-terminal dimerisation domain-containing protein n=1 Tax=Chilo suppressalis TaxID=168631 RepID=A0ABN8B6C1_CHISP|nr:unnamed protein product [Chilo suppressalis]